MDKEDIELIVFDMDGTLVDSSPGILNGHKFTNVQMGRPEPTDKDLEGIIGGPLLDTYINKFNFAETEARKAVEIYRKRYAEKGLFEAHLYDGMKNTLQELKQQGFKLAVATLKAEIFAKQMLENMGVADLFDVIHGVDLNDSITKSGLVNLCLKELNVNKENAILVGDSVHDFLGAKESGVGFVAALYGFGFNENNSEMFPYKIQNPEELVELLKGKKRNLNG